MVSKVAVMALVAVLAVPILLGYGLNLTETAITEYKPDKESVNVTQFLQNGTAYSDVHADVYQLNTNFTTGPDGTKTVPHYENNITSYTSYRLQDVELERWNPANHNYGLNVYNVYFMQLDYTYNASSRAILTITDSSNSNSQSIDYIHSIYWNNSEKIAYYSYYVSSSDLGYGTYADAANLSYSTNNSSLRVYLHHWYDDRRAATLNYVDFAGGYYFSDYAAYSPFWDINLPERTSSVLMTMDLDSITTNFNMTLGPGSFRLAKSSGGEWEISKGTTHIPLYYDPSRSDNTYQIKIYFEFTKVMPDAYNNDRKYYKINLEFRYVGGWPTAIGEANYYQKYNLETEISIPITDPDYYMDSIRLSYPLYGKTPVVRMDDAIFAGFSQPAIVDKIYDPASFKTNPSTTINNISRYGDSIGFADQMYQVGSDGNIMIGTRSIPVNGIIMESVPMPGGYENKINGYVISTSNDPSTVRFYGTWLANITTDSQTANTYNTTVWNVGEFAWDGIDQNFLMVGLLTCFGVFIALGIYLRKTKSSLWPLLIVCGCAAGLFFCMI